MELFNLKNDKIEEVELKPFKLGKVLIYVKDGGEDVWIILVCLIHARICMYTPAYTFLEC